MCLMNKEINKAIENLVSACIKFGASGKHGGMLYHNLQITMFQKEDYLKKLISRHANHPVEPTARKKHPCAICGCIGYHKNCVPL